MLRKSETLSILILLLAGPLGAQPTTGAIFGRVSDSRIPHAPIQQAIVECRLQGSGLTLTTLTDPQGNYSLLHLAPGLYWIRASKKEGPVNYQAREGYEIEVFVAGEVILDIPMRPMDDRYSQSQ
jgi:hypothetical protein